MGLPSKVLKQDRCCREDLVRCRGHHHGLVDCNAIVGYIKTMSFLNSTSADMLVALGGSGKSPLGMPHSRQVLVLMQVLGHLQALSCLHCTQT